jgi:predicted metal-binding membrane protein
MRVRVPLLAVGAAAWLALAVRPSASVHGAHTAPWTAAQLAVEAVLMFAAMMAPAMGGPLDHVRARSFARRRGRAAALFVLGYALPWIAATAVLLVVGRWVTGAGSPLVPALALAAVVAGQCSPLKQHSLNRCHGNPALGAFGVRADLDVLRFGVRHAGWCIGSCAALMMLPMLFVRGHLALMAGVTIWIAGERLEKPMTPRWRWRGPGRAMRIAAGQARGWFGPVRGRTLLPGSPTFTVGVHRGT